MSNNAVVSYLKVILGSDVEPDIVNYITCMKHDEDYDEFMENIVDKTNTAHINSYNAIKYLLFGGKKSVQQNTNTVKNATNAATQPSGSSKREKKKFKDINLYQEKKKREGRFPCDCMGQEHDFMNNCVECGRIHCLEEGPGPCLFCGTLIAPRGMDAVQIGSKPKNIMKQVPSLDDRISFVSVFIFKIMQIYIELIVLCAVLSGRFRTLTKKKEKRIH